MTEHELLTTGEMAELFRVDPRTIGRWDRAGRFESGAVLRTPSGQRRFRRDKITALLENGQEAGHSDG